VTRRGRALTPGARGPVRSSEAQAWVGEPGVYLGLEGLRLVTWLGSWIILHPLLRKREIEGMTLLVVFLAGMALAALLLRPPVIHLILRTA
jgi:hypothetical protein